MLLFKIKFTKEIRPINSKIKLWKYECSITKFVMYDIIIRHNKPLKPNSLIELDFWNIIEDKFPKPIIEGIIKK